MKIDVKFTESAAYRRGLGIFLTETPLPEAPEHFFRPLFARTPYFTALWSDLMAVSKTSRRKQIPSSGSGIALLVAGLVLLSACTQEQQNKIGRGIQNWTGTSGVLEVYAGDKLMRRFIQIDKLTTATGTDDNKLRPYRYGYGYLDENLNLQVDPNEKKVYFEISDYATNYVFFENPR
jgi:hypothetical protein